MEDLQRVESSMFQDRPGKDAIMLLDHSGRIIDSNPAGWDLFGTGREHFVGSGLAERLMIGHVPSKLNSFDELPDATSTVTAIRADGSKFPAKLSVHRTDNNGCRHNICVLRDLSVDDSLVEATADTLRSSTEQFFALACEMMVALDRDWRVTMINHKGCELLRCRQEDALGHDWFEQFVPAESQTEGRMAFARGLQTLGTTPIPFQSKVVDREGEQHDIAWSIAPVTGLDGDMSAGLLAVGLDITHQLMAAHQLKTTRENLNSLVEKNRSGILIIDSEGLIQFANPAAEVLLGRPMKELVGSSFGIPSLGLKLEMDVLRPDGTRGTAEMTVSATEWRGRLANLVMLHDITERKISEARIQHIAYHDALTDLPNRELFNDRLRQAIARATRSGKRMALIFMDLDNFKEVNDSLGHETGDLLLREVAHRLPHCVRESDTVARMGGDEFTVLLENIDSEGDIEPLVAKIQDCLRSRISVNGWNLSTMASLGISFYPDHGADAETLLRRADTAMYFAKRHKGVGASVFRTDMEVISSDQLALSQDIHSAVENEQFFLEYQVKVSLQNHQPEGFESLLRWQHPERGRILPDQFIPLLEDSGAIVAAGRWILREVCRQLSEWIEKTPSPPPVAVNISPRQLNAIDLASEISRVFEDFPQARPYLNLELTESAVMQDLEISRQQLFRLRDMGLSLHMDDFGTGYSSLSVLKKLPFDVIKLDRSFVHGLEIDPESQALTRAAIAMAHSLDKRVIAEGVETHTQYNFLREHGCETGQGWLFARSVAAKHVGYVTQAFQQGWDVDKGPVEVR